MGGFEPVKQSVELPANAFPSEREEPSTLRAEAEKDTTEPGGEVPVLLTKPASSRTPKFGLAHTLPSARPIEFPHARKEPSSKRPAPDVSPPPPMKRVRAPAAPKPMPVGDDKAIGPGRIVLLSLAAAVVAFGVVTLVRGLTGAPAPTASEVPSAAASVGPPVSVAKPAAVQPTLQDLDVPPGVAVAGDKGLLEVDLGAKHAVYVDGAFVGRGPLRRVPLAPGNHQVLLKLPEGEVTVQAEIKAGRRTRVSLPAAP